VLLLSILVLFLWRESRRNQLSRADPPRGTVRMGKRESLAPGVARGETVPELPNSWMAHELQGQPQAYSMGEVGMR
jgi:hypothetical protein